MESAYRMWIKERREELKTADSAELCRELQTALGTAKWQVCLFFLLFFVKLKFGILFFSSSSLFNVNLSHFRTLAFAGYHCFLSISRKLDKSNSISVLSVLSLTDKTYPSFFNSNPMFMQTQRVDFLLSQVSTNIETDIKHSRISPPTFTCMFLSIVVYINCI